MEEYAKNLNRIDLVAGCRVHAAYVNAASDRSIEQAGRIPVGDRRRVGNGTHPPRFTEECTRRGRIRRPSLNTSAS
jgi:hypothetical protein